MPLSAAAVVLASRACSCVVVAGNGDDGKGSEAVVGVRAAEPAGFGGGGCDGESVLAAFVVLRRCCLKRVAGAAGFAGKAADGSVVIHGLRTEPPRNRVAVRLEFSTSRTAAGGGWIGGCDDMMQTGHGRERGLVNSTTSSACQTESYFRDVRAVALPRGAPDEKTRGRLQRRNE